MTVSETTVVEEVIRAAKLSFSDLTERRLHRWWLHDAAIRCLSSSEVELWWPLYRDTYLAEQRERGLQP